MRRVHDEFLRVPRDTREPARHDPWAFVEEYERTQIHDP